MAPISAFRQKLAGILEPHWARLYALTTSPFALDALDPILVLGNQKTGSTAIAHLLAACGDLSLSSDVPPAWQDEPRLITGDASIPSFIQQSCYYFRRDVVKENALTLATKKLMDALPAAQFVYVVRHPAHNIRSILDRLDLPGTPRPLDSLDIASPVWRRVVDSRWLNLPATDHISALAERWNLTTRIYRQCRDHLHLVRYEDFLRDKEGTIRALATDLEVSRRNDIRPLLDAPFQPRGAHRETPLQQFFTDEALAIINRRCMKGMSMLDYSLALAGS